MADWREDFPPLKRQKREEVNRRSPFVYLPFDLFVLLTSDLAEGNPKDLLNFCLVDKQTLELCKKYRTNLPLTTRVSLPINSLQYASYLNGIWDPVRDWLWAWWNWKHATTYSSDMYSEEGEEKYAKFLADSFGQGQALQDFYHLDPKKVSRNDLLLFVISPVDQTLILRSPMLKELTKGGFSIFMETGSGAKFDLEKDKKSAISENTVAFGVPLDDPSDRSNYVKVRDLYLPFVARFLFSGNYLGDITVENVLDALASLSPSQLAEFATKFRALLVSQLNMNLPAFATLEPTIFDFFDIKLALGTLSYDTSRLFLFAKIDPDFNAIREDQPDYWPVVEEEESE